MILFKPNDLQILELYYYPSVAIYQLAEYDYYQKTGDDNIKILFDIILEKASSLAGHSVFDNKIVFKIKHKPTNKEFYIGYKDDKYTIGLGVKSEFGYKKVFEISENN
jgi:hypothetical protein